MCWQTAGQVFRTLAWTRTEKTLQSNITMRNPFLKWVFDAETLWGFPNVYATHRLLGFPTVGPLLSVPQTHPRPAKRPQKHVRPCLQIHTSLVAKAPYQTPQRSGTHTVWSHMDQGARVILAWKPSILGGQWLWPDKSLGNVVEKRSDVGVGVLTALVAMVCSLLPSCHRIEYLVLDDLRSRMR